LVVAVNAAVPAEPAVACAPLHPPEAVHEVAWVDDHASVDLAPLAIEAGAALKVTVGAALVTVMVADCEALPPLPVQVSPYVALAVRFPVDFEPLVPRVPLQAPVAVQEVALLDDQVSVEAEPL
jgi:hypothetical protein